MGTSQNIAKCVPNYIFEFSEEIDRTKPAHVNFPPGAYHGSDVPYLFDLKGRIAPFDETQVRFSEKVIKYWTNFAAKGNPNGSGLPTWSKGTVRKGYGLSLDSDGRGIRPVNLVKGHQSEFWDELYPQ
ncbi:para-nitrobenzyl esterase [Sinosporangium album]|uniref:Para-nitrobenzyl esterase n=1 Tax=Sinosporangium album TaxID=504805 RepID=A0A1G8KP55_9ACTN|nr:carboxylesterase family protein [Sinosporangium album]SDI45255.1 para-nitrobenzyl esterase [Sinosporangium album]